MIPGTRLLSGWSCGYLAYALTMPVLSASRHRGQDMVCGAHMLLDDQLSVVCAAARMMLRRVLRVKRVPSSRGSGALTRQSRTAIVIGSLVRRFVG